MRAVAAIKSPANSPGGKTKPPGGKVSPVKSRLGSSASPAPGASASSTAGFNASPLVDSLIAERMITHNPFFSEQESASPFGRMRKGNAQSRKLSSFTNLQMSDLLLLKNAFDAADVDGAALFPLCTIVTFSKTPLAPFKRVTFKQALELYHRMNSSPLSLRSLTTAAPRCCGSSCASTRTATVPAPNIFSAYYPKPVHDFITCPQQISMRSIGADLISSRQALCRGTSSFHSCCVKIRAPAL